MLIGLAGRICSGKNYVGRLLALRGLEVWDLDRVAEKIRNNRRTEVMKLFGTTDKAEIASIVFNNPEKLAALENLIYPELRKQILEYPYDLVINGALLKTGGFDSICDFVIYVDAPREERQRRAQTYRGIGADEFERRDNTQSFTDPSVSKYECPVVVIENFGKTDAALIADLDRIFSHPPKS
jgi:dephospho-CoA kinase